MRKFKLLFIQYLGQLWAEDLGITKDITTIIPLSNLSNGIYILKVNTGGSIQEKEVVVER